MMAVIAIVFAGCDKKLIEPENPKQEQEEPTPEPVVGAITLDGEASVTLSCEGGSKNVAFAATQEWTATASEDFVTVGPTRGAAGDGLKITVSVPEYQGYDDRTATITLTCGEDIKTIQVTQKRKGALVLAASTIQVAAEGETIAIVAQANSNVTAAIAEDAKAWISELKGLVDYGFTFVVAANEAVEARTGQIVFTNESGETETITLEQAGTPIVGKITLQGEDAFEVSDEGDSFVIDFNATLEWTASSNEEFVSVTPTSGEAGDVSITLTVAANDSYDPRTATVTLTCEDDVKTIEITQKQKGALLLTESTISVPAEGGNVTVVAKANSNVTAAIADDAQAWISELKGLVEYSFNFVVAANESEEARTGKIVFTNEYGSETVTIKQVGTDPKLYAAAFAVEGTAPFKTLWTNGDVLAINGVESDALVLDVDAATAEFVMRDTLAAPFNALYPASVLKAETADVVTLPAQAYVSEVAAEAVLPMATQAHERTLAFKQLMSIVKFTITSEESYTLDYAELSASQKLHGDFTVDYSAATLAATVATDAEKTLRCELDNELTAEGVNLYFVVPAAEYTSLSLNLVDVEGKPMTYTTETLAAAAGAVTEVAAFEFKPEQFSIATAADFVKFATLYNANKLDTKVKVTLVDDIVFDEETNAAWTPIGTAAADNDGAVDNYFSGYINGQGYSIKNWNSTRPLFAYTSADAVIKDLTIDASCTLTANNTSNNQYYGAFVGYHRGLLANCHVNANLVGSGNWDNSEPHIGALAGRVVVGTVENCTVNGDVTFDNTLVTGGKNSYFGGAVGRVSNKDGELKGISVKGNVSLSAGSTYIEDGSANANDAFVKYGGIVGQLAGTCTDCHLTEATKKFFYGNFVYDGGATNVVNNNYRTQQIGGIVGEIYEGGVLSNCTNHAAVVFNQYNGEANGASGDVSRYLYGGGIAGQINGELSHCAMYGSLENRSSCLQQFIGGVVGHVQANSSVHYCANEGAEIAAGTSGNGYYQARNNNIGGVIGLTLSTNLSNLANKAELLCSRMNSKNSATLSMGGVIGKIEATSGEINGQGAIVNYGKVYSNHNQYDNQYTAVGGVIGEARCSVKGVVNEGSAFYVIGTDAVVYKHVWVGGVVGYANGELTLTALENKGTAYINISKAVNQKHYNLCVGGVLGTNADAKAVTLVNCVNSGSAAFQGGGTKTNGRSIALGGIVGALTNGASSIAGCSNTGCISNTSSNNMTSAWVIRSAGGSNYVGGIAGYIEGAEGDLLEVTNCVNNRTAGTDDKVGNGSYAIYTLRGSAGALVGGAKYGDVTNGTVTTYIYNTNSTVTGSVVGSITNSNISNCVATNCTLNPHTGCAACGGCVGETVASTIADITLNGITILEPSATTTGAIAGKSDATSTFTNIKLKGQIGDASISASSTMIAIDSGATVTDIFILD